MNNEQLAEFDRFLSGVEKRALRMAEIAVGEREDALDIVQDAMLQLARRYPHKPAQQWPPLFYRILENRIKDCYRRRGRRSQVFAPSPRRSDDPQPAQAEERIADQAAVDPGAGLDQNAALARLEQALGGLPTRQRQAFMLRIWEGLDVAATARAMGCSGGSVKTHLSRALGVLRSELAGYWP